MTGETRDNLIRMINQIARNLALEHSPTDAIVEHITAFWTPSMRAKLIDGPADGLSDLALEARAALRAKANQRDDH